MPRRLCLLYAPTTSGLDEMNVLKGKAPKGLEYIVVKTVDEALDVATTAPDDLACVVAKAGTTAPELATNLFKKLNDDIDFFEQVFNVIYSHTLSNQPASRLHMMDHEDFKIHMVTHVEDHLLKVLNLLSAEGEDNGGDGKLTCPLCEKTALTELQMWHHLPLFHVDIKKGSAAAQCPSCTNKKPREPLLVHYHDAHLPPGQHQDRNPPTALHAFGLCVIQRKSDQKFLVVQEYMNQGYWLPGGGIDPSERPEVAAQRECLEEAGVDVDLTGIIRIECSPHFGSTRMRYFFYGHPKDESLPCKTYPDFESMGAAWVTAEEILSGKLKLRGSEPAEWFQYIAKGGSVYPMSLLTYEGAPAVIPSNK